jgi:hypothetical protein
MLYKLEMVEESAALLASCALAQQQGPYDPDPNHIWNRVHRVLHVRCRWWTRIWIGRARSYTLGCKMISMSASVIVSRMSQFTMYRLNPSRMREA